MKKPLRSPRTSIHVPSATPEPRTFDSSTDELHLVLHRDADTFTLSNPYYIRSNTSAARSTIVGSILIFASCVIHRPLVLQTSLKCKRITTSSNYRTGTNIQHFSIFQPILQEKNREYSVKPSASDASKLKLRNHMYEYYCFPHCLT